MLSPKGKPLTKKDAVAESLRNEILSGRLPPDTALNQQEVAQSLGVSPTPVREAFAVLEAEGFLRRHPYRGVVVAPSYQDDIVMIYEIRAFVECFALKRATRISASAIADLERVFAEAARARKIPEVHSWRMANTQFHLALARLAGSALINDVVSLLLQRSLFVTPFDLDRMNQIQREHLGILAALKRGDHEAAADLLRLDLEDAVKALKSARSNESRIDHRPHPLRLSSRASSRKRQIPGHQGRVTSPHETRS